jgi:hypothetical protein
MSMTTHNHRLQPRWTLVAFPGEPGPWLWPTAAAALSERGAGCFATRSCDVGDADVASEPGRARLRRDDT